MAHTIRPKSVNERSRMRRAPQRALEPANRVAGETETDGRLCGVTHTVLQVRGLLDTTPHGGDVAGGECLRAGVRGCAEGHTSR